MTESVPFDGAPTVPPARDIPSTFMASLRSWSALTLVILRRILIVFLLGGQQEKRRLPLVRNAY
jgi:hypothetical protein